MKGWGKCELGDVLTFQRGFDLPNQRRVHGEYPIVSSNGISDYHNEFKVKGPGIVTGRYGTIGEVFFIRDNFWPLNTSLFVKDFKGNDIRFLSYLLKTINIKGLNAAGAVPGVNRNHLHKIKIRIPPLPTQRRIASILSAYDDLIENNLKRIKLLEELAQRTYEEWFVRMKFPGHENTPINAETGLPVGWERKKIRDSCIISGGGTPSRKDPEYWDNGVHNWYSPTDLTKASSIFVEHSSEKITDLGLSKSSAKLLNCDSFMMSSRATIGLFAITDSAFSTNQGFINITPFKSYQKEYLLYNFKRRIEEFSGFATGATFPELSKSKFRVLEILWPDENLIQSFNSFVKPVHDNIIRLTKQNRLLKESRDILLPRLMGGTISIKS